MTTADAEYAKQREALAYFESLPLDSDQMRELAARIAPSYVVDAAAMGDTPERVRDTAVKALTLQSCYGQYFSEALMRASEITGGYTVWDVDGGK